MNPASIRKALSGTIILILAGCGSGAAEDSTLVHSSDPELRADVAALLPGLAARAGLDLVDPVRIEWRGREALQRYVRYRLDQDLPESEAQRIVQSYALLGMVPEELDLRELLLSVYLEQVAGFYDPDSTALFIMEDQSTENVEAVLLHELVHALQDQHVSLDSLTARERGNDRRAAAHAALEGHATMVMLEYLTEQLQGSPVDLSELPDFAETSRPALQAMTDQYPVLAGAPAVVRESLLFPYVEGSGYVHALWRREEERTAPLGAFMPSSTRQVLEAEAFVEDELPAPVDLTIEAPTESRILYENDLGRLEAEILLREHGVTGQAAEGLRGDRFILVETEGEPGLLWASVWDDSESRQRFVDALLPALEGFPVGAILEVVDISGEPGALLRVGSARGATVVDIRSVQGRP